MSDTLMNVGATLPPLILAVGACLLFIIDLFVPQDKKQRTAWVGLAITGVALVFAISGVGGPAVRAFSGMFIADTFTAVVGVITGITTLVSILAARDYLQRAKIERGEYYPLLMVTAAGAILMAAAGDLLMVLIALELLSIPLYILVGFRRPELRSEEGAMKYFLLGAFSSGFMVYGIALVYGAAGTTQLSEIFAAAQSGQIASDALLLLGVGLLFVSLAFKVAVVPFHMWTPDVYQGAPTPVTAYMSVAAKIGGFAALLRVMTLALPAFSLEPMLLEAGQSITMRTAWQDLAAIVAAVTMLVGNIIAISQRDLKRMLAYSSIAHAGYIMMAVAAAGSFVVTADDFGVATVSLSLAENALKGGLIYLAAYAFTNIGAFAVVMSVERDDASGTAIDDLRGIGQSKPLLALAMTIFMLSLTGIPLTAGFVGKWFVFSSSLNAGLTLLALIGVLTSVISAFYYLRVIVTLWFEPGEGIAKVQPALGWAIAICAVGTILAGVLPPVLVNLAEAVALAMR
jgi:NADH-quinone oxidoreductase subunit N